MALSTPSVHQFNCISRNPLKGISVHTLISFLHAHLPDFGDAVQLSIMSSLHIV